MKREIQPHPAIAEPIAADSIGDVKDWLQTQAVTHRLAWLLAHADDGVIWGKVNDRVLIVSSDIAPSASPLLRSETLQSARLFAPDAELLLWRDGDNAWRARLIREVNSSESPEWDEAFDEPQMLWGTHGEHLPGDFTLLRDGAQGLRHVVPIKLPLDSDGETKPPRLIVRHYINKDGFARIVASRLVDLKEEKAK